MTVDIYYDNLTENTITNNEVKRIATRAIVIKNKAILLVYNQKKRQYMLPGGALEENETLEQCIKRELLEEVGVIAEPKNEPILTIREFFKTGCYVNKYFVCEIQQLGLKRKLTRKEQEEKLSFRWIHQNDAIWLLSNSDSDYPYTQNVHNREIIAIKEYLVANNQIETWKLYNKDGQYLNKTALRGEKLKPGEYHKVVNIWIKNENEEFLLQKRSPNKPLPNVWSITGGSLTIEDEDDLVCAIRETKEELGITLFPENGRKIETVVRDNSILEIWLFIQSINLKDCVLQFDEVVDVTFVNKKKLTKMLRNGSFFTSVNIIDLI